MNGSITVGRYGRLVEPSTLQIQRLLPGPLDRVWAYLTQSDLRSKWLAAGDMDPDPGATFELKWRNDELGASSGRRPEGFAAEQRMTSRIMAIDPPRSLSFTWEDGGEVTFDLAPAGDRVLLTITHRRLRGRDTMLAVSAGWHAHADILEATLLGRMPQPFWDSWTSLRNDYDRRLPHVEAGRPREPGEKR